MNTRFESLFARWSWTWKSRRGLPSTWKVLILSIFVLCGAGEALATCFDNLWSSYSYWEADAGVALICPKGDGTMSVSVEVWILNNCLEPLANPTDADDIKITWSGGAGTCSLDSPDESILSWETLGNGAWHASYDTDGSGYTVITGSPMCGSGYAEAYRLEVERISTIFPQPITCLPIAVRSPDLNLDGVIDVLDFAIFGDYYGESYDQDVYSRRSDLNASGGTINAADYAIFGAHYNHSCEDCPRSQSASCNP